MAGVQRRPLNRVALGRAAAPVRVLHLGLGNFCRAHLLWYTHHAPDAAAWGVAAFPGQAAGDGLAQALAAQDGLYTLVARGADGDGFETITSLSAANAVGDDEAWRAYWRDPALSVVTLTITEFGYAAKQGRLDPANAAVAVDLAGLVGGQGWTATSAMGRLCVGLIARQASDAGPILLLPCDNVPGNGALLRAVLTDCVHRLGRPDLLDAVSFGSTEVDRITPAPPADLAARVAAATGWDDRAAVETEPFAEWTIAVPDGSVLPDWASAGARFVDDVTPFEERKLTLLNGAHSLLAYTAPLRGHETVGEAILDPVCRAWVEAWWTEAIPHLGLPAPELTDYCAALVERFANPRIHHRLAQIAADGTQKLPIRIVPTIRAERAARRMPLAGARAIAGWVLHLRGRGVPVTDPGASSLVAAVQGSLDRAVAAVLAALDPALADDGPLRATVTDLAAELNATD